jgi:hypothetical protein
MVIARVPLQGANGNQIIDLQIVFVRTASRATRRTPSLRRRDVEPQEQRNGGSTTIITLTPKNIPPVSQNFHRAPLKVKIDDIDRRSSVAFCGAKSPFAEQHPFIAARLIRQPTIRMNHSPKIV